MLSLSLSLKLQSTEADYIQYINCTTFLVQLKNLEKKAAYHPLLHSDPVNLREKRPGGVYETDLFTLRDSQSVRLLPTIPYQGTLMVEVDCMDGALQQHSERGKEREGH